MTTLRVAAVQAGYVLMDRAATIDRVRCSPPRPPPTAAELVVFPEVFIPVHADRIDTGRTAAGRRPPR